MLTTMPVRRRLEETAGEALRQQRHDQRLADDECHDETGNQQQLADEQAGVEQHADRDEEESQQHVAKRPDDRLDLVTELGLGQHHAGQKCAESERQADDLGRPRRAEHHQQHREDEELRRARMGDFMEQRPQQPAPGRQHDQQRDAAFEYRAQELRGVAHCRRAPRPRK